MLKTRRPRPELVCSASLPPPTITITTITIITTTKGIWLWVGLVHMCFEYGDGSSVGVDVVRYSVFFGICYRRNYYVTEVFARCGETITR